MVNDAVFKYLKWYILFLISLQILLPIGLSSYISTTMNVQTPTLYTFQQTETCTWGAFCFLVDWGTVIINVGAYIFYFFENMGFLITLSGALNSSAWGIFGLFFTSMTIIFIVCVLDFIKSIGH